jgi:hypothetical protein
MDLPVYFGEIAWNEFPNHDKENVSRIVVNLKVLHHKGMMPGQ